MRVTFSSKVLGSRDEVLASMDKAMLLLMGEKAADDADLKMLLMSAISDPAIEIDFFDEDGAFIDVEFRVMNAVGAVVGFDVVKKVFSDEVVRNISSLSIYES